MRSADVFCFVWGGVGKTSRWPRQNNLMATANEEHRDPIWVATIHWSLIAFGVVAPWLLHFTVAWWAAWLAIVVCVVVYDRLFVLKGSICMGIPFMLPLGATMLLLLVQAIHLLKWSATRFGGG